jgi:hypothetical protein
MSPIERNEAISRAADTIWPLDGLSTDEAREELLRDMERAIGTYLDATGAKVTECCEVCERVRDALAGADIGQDEGLAFDVAVLQAAWEEMHREAKQTRAVVEALREIKRIAYVEAPPVSDEVPAKVWKIAFDALNAVER